MERMKHHIPRGILAALLVVGTHTSAVAAHHDEPHLSPPVPPADLYRMLEEQQAAEAACGELMPVWTKEGIECREPTEDWWRGQP